MPMYKLLEYNGNYSMTSRSLQNYKRYEVNDDANENNGDIYKKSNVNTTTGESLSVRQK